MGGAAVPAAAAACARGCGASPMFQVVVVTESEVLEHEPEVTELDVKLGWNEQCSDITSRRCPRPRPTTNAAPAVLTYLECCGGTMEARCPYREHGSGGGAWARDTLHSMASVCTSLMWL